MTTGGRQPSRSAAAPWSAPASGSLGCSTDVKAGAGSASCTGVAVGRGEKVAHAPAFPFGTLRQNTAAAWNPP